MIHAFLISNLSIQFYRDITVMDLSTKLVKTVEQ